MFVFCRLRLMQRLGIHLLQNTKGLLRPDIQPTTPVALYSPHATTKTAGEWNVKHYPMSNSLAHNHTFSRSYDSVLRLSPICQTCPSKDLQGHYRSSCNTVPRYHFCSLHNTNPHAQETSINLHPVLLSLVCYVNVWMCEMTCSGEALKAQPGQLVVSRIW